jgi:hypothetical protein
MTESDLLKVVLQLAEEHGVLAHHCNDSRRCSGDNGMPDLILIGKRHIIYVELKSWGRLTQAQRLWKNRLEAAGQEHLTWTPYELKTGEIQETLAWL